MEPVIPPSAADWAIVLGVSMGTGAAIARQLSVRPGLNIHGIHRGRNPAAAAAVAADVAAAGRQAWWVEGDAGSAVAAREGALAIRERIGRGKVRVLVHSIANASLGPLAVGAGRLESRQVEKTFDSMAHSFVYWVRELVQNDLLAPGACILALGNPVTDSLADDLALIAAAKAALEIYVRALAAELGPAGHRVNLLKFGLVDTRASKLAFAPDEWEPVRLAASRSTPAGRLCTVEEVARFVSVLAGPDASWFNGATIDFTGGMTQSLLNLVHHPSRPAAVLTRDGG